MDTSRRWRFTAGFAAITIYLFYLHGKMVHLMPGPILQPDSSGYLSPAINALTGGSFAVPESRTWGYPLWLLFWLRITGRILGVLIAQHIAAVLGAALAAGLAARFFRLPGWAALIVFLLAGALPRAIVYSHCILTDDLYMVCFVACAYVSLLAWEKLSTGRSIALGACAFLSLMIRPTGRVIVGCAALVWIIRAAQSKSVRAALFGAGTLLILWGGASALNLQTRGFWGLERFTGIPLFGTVARYLSPAQISDIRLRNCLEPFYRSPSANFSDANWVRFDPNGPISALTHQIQDPKQLDAILVNLSRAAIAHAPFQFARDQVKAYAKFLWERSRRPRNLAPKQLTWSQSLAQYGELCRSNPRAWRFLPLRPESVDANLHKLALTPMYPYEPDRWTRWLWPWVYMVGWIPVVALAIMPVLLFFRSTRFPAALLWLLISGHIVLSNLGGDWDGRHALPAEPLFLVLIAGGLAILGRHYRDGLTRVIGFGRRRFFPTN